MDKISLIPTFKVLHWTISLRTFVLIANRKLIFSLPWGRNTLAYKESRWLSPEAGWRGLFYRESDVFPPPSCTLSGLSLLRIHTGTHTRPLAPTFWEGSPFMTANTLGFTIIYFFPKTFPNNVLLFPAVSLGCRGWWDSMSIPELVAVNSIWGGKWDAQKSRSHSGPMTEIGWDERETREHMIP